MGERSMRILVVGASGFIGQHLIPFLQKQGHEVASLHRHTPSWDPEKGICDEKALEGFDVIINLAGESVSSGRWTRAKKQRIWASRVQATKLLSDTILKLKMPPQLLINSSAAGIYGSRGEEFLTENAALGQGFLARVCTEWEAAALFCQGPKLRVVCLRMGVVIGLGGGILKKLLPLFTLGLGGKIGSGKQWMSWITLVDLLRIIAFVIQDPTIHGPINCVAPHPVTNEELTKSIARFLHRPCFFTVPLFLLRLRYGEMVDEALNSSQKVFPDRLLKMGFSFRYSDLPEKFT